MGPLFKLSSLLVLSFLFLKGEGSKCGLENITITQVKTGRVVEGKPEYEVTVRNRCSCSQSKLITRCFGLSSVQPVDRRAIRVVDGTCNCVINGGRPVPGYSSIRFRYAWMTPQDFPLVSSLIQC